MDKEDAPPTKEEKFLECEEVTNVKNEEKKLGETLQYYLNQLDIYSLTFYLRQALVELSCNVSCPIFIPSSFNKFGDSLFIIKSQSNLLQIIWKELYPVSL